MASAITNTTNTASTASAQNVKYEDPSERSTLNQDDFMKLFVTQLQYQDPTKPMDSADMASQVAQFNMVDLLAKNNEAMDKLVTADENRTRMSAVSYMGQDVSYQGNTLTVGDNGPKPFDLDLDGPTASTVVTIRDSNGQLVRSSNLGAMPGGRQSLGWDGLDASGQAVPAGQYTVSVEAKDASGNPVSVKTWTTGTVTGLSYPDTTGLPKLTVDHTAQVDLDEIESIGS